jgi:ATP-binding cassette subfamily B protein
MLRKRITVLDALRSLYDAARITRGWLLLSSVLVLIQAMLPGAQVVLLENLIAAATVPSMAGLIAVVGLMYPLGQVTRAADQRMALRLRLHYRTELAHVAARLSPSRLARPEVMTDLQASQTATAAMGDVPGKPTSVVLCAAVWRINPWSGLLILAALVPTVFAFTLIARAESRGWPKVAEHDRQAAYATEQLVQQRSGTELALLGSSRKVRTWSPTAGPTRPASWTG